MVSFKQNYSHLYPFIYNYVKLVKGFNWMCPTECYSKLLTTKIPGILEKNQHMWSNTVSPCQVKHFRHECGLEQIPAKIQLDSSGLKKLFSHAIRRFCASDGGLKAREASIYIQYLFGDLNITS